MQVGGAGSVMRAHMAQRIYPTYAGHFRVLVGQVHGRICKFDDGEFVVAQITCQTQHLFLLLQQVQTQFLLGKFQVALHAFLFALHLFYPQVTDAADNGQQKNTDGCDRGQ